MDGGVNKGDEPDAVVLALLKHSTKKRQLNAFDGMCTERKRKELTANQRNFLRGTKNGRL